LSSFALGCWRLVQYKTKNAKGPAANLQQNLHVRAPTPFDLAPVNIASEDLASEDLAAA
jgi:hypothetical protein